jgi:opacity protein-like surface antigen
MFVPHWSVFLEYNFMGFGTRSATVVGCGGICAFSGKADIQNVLAGVNYKF